jgi:hypothetical protein
VVVVVLVAAVGVIKTTIITTTINTTTTKMATISSKISKLNKEGFGNGSIITDVLIALYLIVAMQEVVVEVGITKVVEATIVNPEAATNNRMADINNQLTSNKATISSSSSSSKDIIEEVTIKVAADIRINMVVDTAKATVEAITTTNKATVGVVEVVIRLVTQPTGVTVMGNDALFV